MDKRRTRQALEEASLRLKQIVADQVLYNRVLKELFVKNLRPEGRRLAVAVLIQIFELKLEQN